MTRQHLPAVDTATTSPMAPKGSLPVVRSQLTVLGASVALALATLSTDASALALGPLKVLSSLGEPLRAEIEIPQITSEEADSMRIGMASPGAFSAAGVSYNPALADVRISLERRGSRYVVSLRGTRSLNDPFLDVLLEANWRSGRVVRDYTVLLDPPASPRSQQAIAPIAPQVSTPRPLPQAPAAAYSGSSTTRSAPVAPPAPVRAAPSPVAPVEAAPSAGASDSGGQQVTVRAGDTAGAIARANKAPEISLDQMLVAMLRANPDAFIGKNVNRVKAGAVLTMPSAREAAEVSPTEAKRMLVAQSRDFNQYRRSLAEAAPTSSVAEADRSTGGKLQADVQDRNAAAQSPDKLTITPGTAAANKATVDEKLVKDRQAAADAARVAELSRNLNELNKIQSAGSGTAAPAGASSSAPSAPGAPGATAPGLAVPVPGAGPAASTSPTTGTTPAASPAAGASATGTPAPAAASGTPPVAVSPAVPASTAAGSAPAGTDGAAPATSAASSTPAPAPAPAAAAPAKPKPKAPPPPPPKSFFEELMDNPIMLGAIGLIVLLLAFLGLRVINRRKAASSESVFLESRIPKDSFFGSSGGESVDTKNQGAATSSMSYSPSQLDTGDVDPVAEADVYLAYGRDLQAEEILREALRINPDRAAIHLKLLEIHAKRRDLRAFEAQATEVRKLTGGTGTDWARAVELGRDLDPGNPLYQSASAPARTSTAAMTPAVAAVAGAAAAGAAAAIAPVQQAPAVAAEPPPPEFVPSVAPLDFDLELDSKPARTPDTAPMPVSASLPPVAPKTAPAVATALESVAALDFGSLENDFDTAPAALEPSLRPRSRLADDEEHTQPATLRAGLPGDSGFVEFDVSTRSGMLGGNTSPAALEPMTDDGGENPHSVKLTLARELHALGDAEGARSLVEEVAAETTGDLHTQAQQLLAQLR